MDNNFLKYFKTSEYDEKIIFKNGDKNYPVKEIKSLLLSNNIEDENLRLAINLIKKSINNDDIEFYTSGSTSDKRNCVKKTIQNLIIESNDLNAAADAAEPVAATTFTENIENNQENLGKANQEESPKNENTITAERFSLLSQECEDLKNKNAELQEKYSKLEQDYSELLTFKKNVENEKKDELIKSFYMLSNEDKKDVMENKEKYSLDEIEAKLSVICFRKKINFASEKKEPEGEPVAPVTYSLQDETEDVPAWLNSIRDAHNKNK